MIKTRLWINENCTYLLDSAMYIFKTGKVLNKFIYNDRWQYIIEKMLFGTYIFF